MGRGGARRNARGAAGQQRRPRRRRKGCCRHRPAAPRMPGHCAPAAARRDVCRAPRPAGNHRGDCHEPGPTPLPAPKAASTWRAPCTSMSSTGTRPPASAASTADRFVPYSAPCTCAGRGGEAQRGQLSACRAARAGQGAPRCGAGGGRGARQSAGRTPLGSAPAAHSSFAPSVQGGIPPHARAAALLPSSCVARPLPGPLPHPRQGSGSAVEGPEGLVRGAGVGVRVMRVDGG